MQKAEKADRENTITRRQLMQVGAAVVALASGGALVGCEKKKRVAKKTHAAPVALCNTCDQSTDDPTSYPALAMWLVLTTDCSLINCDRGTVEGLLGLKADALKTGWERAQNTTSFDDLGEDAPTTPQEMYDKLRDDFSTARKLVYTGVQCPKSLKPLIDISRLPSK